MNMSYFVASMVMSRDDRRPACDGGHGKVMNVYTGFRHHRFLIGVHAGVNSKFWTDRFHSLLVA